MQFLVDAQLPPALATWLSDQGHTAVHVYDLDLGRASDPVIWDRAIALGAVIVTKDEDFAVRRVLEAAGPPVVWIRFGNTTRSELLRRFAHHFSGVTEALERGEPLVEID